MSLAFAYSASGRGCLLPLLVCCLFSVSLCLSLPLPHYETAA